MAFLIRLLSNICSSKIRPLDNVYDNDICSNKQLNDSDNDDINNSLSDFSAETNKGEIDINNSNKELFNYKLNVKTRIHDIKTPLNNIVLSVNSDYNISSENKLSIIESAFIIKDLLNDLLKNSENLTDFKFIRRKININKLISKIQNLIKSEMDNQKKILS